MINGDADYLKLLETKQKPLFDMLDTPPEHKKHYLIDGGHMPDKAIITREALVWLDRYQTLTLEDEPENKTPRITRSTPKFHPSNTPHPSAP